MHYQSPLIKRETFWNNWCWLVNCNGLQHRTLKCCELTHSNRMTTNIEFCSVKFSTQYCFAERHTPEIHHRCSKQINNNKPTFHRIYIYIPLPQKTQALFFCKFSGWIVLRRKTSRVVEPPGLPGLMAKSTKVITTKMWRWGSIDSRDSWVYPWYLLCSPWILGD